MSILHILGNGFDVNLGMETKYSDFYRDYISEPTNDPLIDKLKNEIGASPDTGDDKWSDLELSLGKHTSLLKNLEEFDRIHDHIFDALNSYLKSVENDNRDRIKKEVIVSKFVEDVFEPEKNLQPADREDVVRFIGKLSAPKNNVNFMTFNYTKTLEHVFDSCGIKLNTPVTSSNSSSTVGIVRDVKHIHGTLERNMILGVNDISQIDNRDFRDNEDIVSALVKPESNVTNKSLVDRQCEQLISGANVICVFGSSIGKTDKKWWDLISKRVNTGSAKLLLFGISDNLSPEKSHKNNREERKLLSALEGIIAKNVHVSLNSNMFKILG